MEYLFLYLMIGFLIAAALVLSDVDDWRGAALRLLIVTVIWLPVLCFVWFFFVVFSGALPKAEEKEVQS